MTEVLFWTTWALLGLLAGTFTLGCGWGSGLHIHFTRQVLDILRRRRLLRPEHRLVLEQEEAFLYGNIAADLINFKNYGGMKNHCHNWNIQERLKVLATTDLERAFVLGYLSHLASDIVAHNHFIPYHRVRGLPPLILGHAYWEALADSAVTDEEWEIVKSLRYNRALHRNDRMIWEAVRWRALGHRSNKWIFNNILLLNLRRSWRDLIRRARLRRSRYPLDMEFFRHCRAHCIHNMLQVFDGEKLAVLKLRDPTGRPALRHARLMRHEILLKYGRTPEGRSVSRKIAREAYWVI